MIPVKLAPEPLEFNARVRVPGSAFLRSVPRGQRVNFARRNFWRRASNQLHEAYDGICAYTCHWIPFDVGSDTVEHFVPKSVRPMLAYEWSNFRLACSRLNSRKGAFRDVVDPFRVTNTMFYLNFPSLCVVVGKLKAGDRRLAASTIKRLKLNDNRSIKMRQRFIESYVNNEVSLHHIRKHAPFLARELTRQRMSKNTLSKVMRIKK